MIIHENSYKGRGFVSFSHRARLKSILRILLHHGAFTKTSWADFGCSNGYIIEYMIRSGNCDFSRIVGYDHKEELLNLGREKNLPSTEFIKYNLNNIERPKEEFELVTCFETLEHVGSYKEALINLNNHLASGGILVIGIPNEIGMPGLVKFLGRQLVRRNPYEEFFQNQSKFKYFSHLMFNKSIDIYRDPQKQGYGPHLGFDYRRLEKFITEEFIHKMNYQMLEKRFGFLHMAVFYILLKP